jgi:hypothetical protein
MTWRIALVTAAVLVLVAGIAAAVIAYMHSTRDVTVTIDNEQRVCSTSYNPKGGSTIDCEYLVYSTGGTFADTDSLLSGKFNSSDVFGELRIGHTYTLRVRGYRLGFLSEYPNILSIVSGQ